MQLQGLIWKDFFKENCSCWDSKWTGSWNRWECSGSKELIHFLKWYFNIFSWSVQHLFFTNIIQMDFRLDSTRDHIFQHFLFLSTFLKITLKTVVIFKCWKITTKSIEYQAFYGIPFAQPPLGDLRFR